MFGIFFTFHKIQLGKTPTEALLIEPILFTKTEEEIVRIIILTILHTSRQHCHCQLVVHGQDSLRRGNTVHDNKLAIK